MLCSALLVMRALRQAAQCRAQYRIHKLFHVVARFPDLQCLFVNAYMRHLGEEILKTASACSRRALLALRRLSCGDSATLLSFSSPPRVSWTDGVQLN